jgi:hypothetical protein
MRRTATNIYLPRALLVLLAVGAMLLALVGAKPAWAEGLSFAPVQKLPLESVGKPLTADFNGDGKEDLVVTNSKANQVSAMLGNGNGTFQEKKDFALAAQPYSITNADFNGDGKEDLATANYDSASASSSISVLLGNADGTFQEKKDFAVEGKPNNLTSADFNGDGKEDLAVTNNYSTHTTTTPSNVSVLLGNGDGTFQSAKKAGVGPRPVSVISADFNGDGKADLAVANNHFLSSDPSGVSVLLGKGDGTLQTAVDYAAGSSPDHVISADFDGDGNEDLATANYGSDFTGGGGVLVMSGKGDGTFQAPTSVAEQHNKPNSITAADFDGDRNVDLATTHYDFADGNPGYVTVRLGYGDGANFQEPQNFTVANYARSIKSPDLNGDNYPDLVTSHGPETYGLAVLMNIPPPEDTAAPTVDGVWPEDGAEDVWSEENVYAYFSEAMDRSTLTNKSFTLTKQGSSEPIEAQVSYYAPYREATLDPDADLEEGATYTATVKGESSGTEDVVKDAHGNTLATDKTWSFKVPDYTPPAAPSKPDLDTASDKGYSNSDDVTNVNTPTFTGTAESGSMVKILIDGVEKGSATAATDGSYKVTTSTLADGAHSATATATDAAGNTGGQSSALSFTIDTKAPVATAPVHSYAVPSRVASASSTSTVPVQLTWSGTDSGSGIDKYELQQSLDRGTFAPVTSPTSSSLSQQLKPGTTLYKFQVRAEDKAGNASVFVAGQEFKVTTYQETPTSTVSYPAGTWSTQSVADAYGGSLRYASAKGAKAIFSVPAGTKNVAWVALKASNRGKADVYLDGSFQKTVDLYSASPLARQLVFSKDVSPTTSHKLEVRVLGTNQSASSGKRVDIDAFLATG